MYEAQPVSDIDSIFRLPLEPLASLFQSASLPKNVLTKERVLDPTQGAAVEFFRSKKSGGGMRSIGDTIRELNLSKRDSLILKTFGTLPSYDPFTLRKALREAMLKLNHALESEGGPLTLPRDLPLFDLTPAMQNKLAEHTKAVTTPLVHMIMTGSNEHIEGGVETPAGLIALVNRARTHGDNQTLERLRRNLLVVGTIIGTSDMKQIEIELAIYGDTMLALGYLKHYYFEVFANPFRDFVHELAGMEKDRKLQADVYGLTSTLKSLAQHLNDSIGAVEEVLTTLDQRVGTIWTRSSPDQFVTVRNLILNCHNHVASLLCGWGARVGSWTTEMSAHRLNSRNAQADFIIHNISPGIEALPSPETLRQLLRTGNEAEPAHHRR